MTIPRLRERRQEAAAADDHAEALERAKGYPYPRLSSSFLFVSGEGGGVIAFRDDWVTNTPAALPAGTSAATPNIGEEEAGLQLEHVLDCPTLDGSMCVRHALETMGWSGAMVAAAAAQPRTPVLSVGSNAAPQQLARKYAAHPGEVILVVQATLHGFDCVYAPLISGYGSVCATLEASPGTRVSTFVTHLTHVQLEHMNATEGGYNLLRLRGLQLHEGQALEAISCARGDGNQSGRLRSTALAYVHKKGTLHLTVAIPATADEARASQSGSNRSGGSVSTGGGPAARVGSTSNSSSTTTTTSSSSSSSSSSPVALAEIPAVGRRYPALHQVHMQAAVRHSLLGQGAGTQASNALAHVPLHALVLACGGDDSEGSESLHAWIFSNLADSDLRRMRVKRLGAAAQPFQHSCSERVLVLPHMRHV